MVAKSTFPVCGLTKEIMTTLYSSVTMSGVEIGINTLYFEKVREWQAQYTISFLSAVNIWATDLITTHSKLLMMSSKKRFQFSKKKSLQSTIINELIEIHYFYMNRAENKNGNISINVERNVDDKIIWYNKNRAIT